MTTGMKVLPRDASDAEFLSLSLARLKLTRVPPPSVSLRLDPTRESALSFCGAAG